MGTRLHNSFIDVLVAVGLDRDTGLRQQLGQNSSIFECPCEPQVLAAISAQVASFPQAFPNHHRDYPPSTSQGEPNEISRQRARRGHSDPQHSTKMPELVNDNSNIATHHHGSLPERRMSRGKSFHTTDVSFRKTFKNLSRGMSSKPPEFPVSSETINNLPHFCFPEKAFIFENLPSDSVHTLVFTDLYGVRSYAACHVFYLPFLVVQENDEYYLMPYDGQPTTECQKCFVPMGTILISQYPYFTAMEQCNSWMASKIKQDPDSMTDILKSFALQLSTTPTPPAGSLAISFKLCPTPNQEDDFTERHITLYPPANPEDNVVDIPLGHIFAHLSVDSVLSVVKALILQQRVVVVSSNIALLTLACETLLHFITPLRWRMTYVPVMTSSQADYMGAPGTFLMGFHSAIMDFIGEVEGIVIVDLDSNKMMDDTSINLPDLPKEVITLFKTSFQTIQLDYEVENLGRPFPCSIDEHGKRKAEFQRKCNMQISGAFLELMVNLLGSVLDHIKPEINTFNQKKYLESQNPEDLKFYEELVTTETFQTFLKDRLNNKHDAWYSLAEKTRPSNKRNSRAPPAPSPLAIRPRSSTRRRSTLLSAYQNECCDVTVYNLTYSCYGPSESFYFSCINDLTKLILQCKSVPLLASYLYIKAMVQVAAGEALEGLQTFNELYSKDRRLVKKEIIRDIMDQLTTDQKNELLEADISSSLKKMRMDLGDRRNSLGRVKIDFDIVPEKAIHKYTFAELIQKLDLIVDHDTIDRLFQSLTLKRSDILDPYTFQIFYECWKDNETQCHDLKFEDGKLDDVRNECILKISGLVKTDLGMGRLGLTQRRVFFLQDCTQKFHDVIALRDIKTLEKHQVTFVFNAIDVLKIVQKDPNKPPFCVWLKEERNCWFLLVKEMWCGKLIAEEVKEPGIIQQAGQNVLLIDAVIKSGEDEGTCHSSDVEQAAMKLCYYTKRKDEGYSLPPSTRNVLVERINANSREMERRAVECLLYVPGDSSDTDPRLWCGMGMAGQDHGKIKVYDARTCTLDCEFTEPKNMVVAMVLSGRQVWVGSMDGMIYVIDTETVICHQRLMDHSDQVSDVTLSDDKKTVFSSSLNGEIISWDCETVKKKNIINLSGVQSLVSVHAVNGLLYCCIKNEILVIDEDGVHIKSLQYKDENNKVQMLECVLATKTGEIWAGCKSQGRLVVWDKDYQRSGILHVSVEKCRGIASLIQVHDKVWAGGKSTMVDNERCGCIFTFDIVTHRQDENILTIHSDTVRSMCLAEHKYVISGSGSSDGHIAIWRAAGAPNLSEDGE